MLQVEAPRRSWQLPCFVWRSEEISRKEAPGKRSGPKQIVQLSFELLNHNKRVFVFKTAVKAVFMKPQSGSGAGALAPWQYSWHLGFQATWPSSRRQGVRAMKVSMAEMEFLNLLLLR